MAMHVLNRSPEATHPLHAWRELVDGNGDGEAQGDFRKRRDAAFARVSRLKEQSDEDLARTVHAHPTMSEAVKEAALAVSKSALHAM